MSPANKTTRSLPDRADRRADRHLEQEFAANLGERARAQATCADEAGHQGDPNRVVSAGFPLQDGAAAAGDLLLAKHVTNTTAGSVGGHGARRRRHALEVTMARLERGQCAMAAAATTGRNRRAGALARLAGDGADRRPAAGLTSMLHTGASNKPAHERDRDHSFHGLPQAARAGPG